MYSFKSVLNNNDCIQQCNKRFVFQLAWKLPCTLTCTSSLLVGTHNLDTTWKWFKCTNQVSSLEISHYHLGDQLVHSYTLALSKLGTVSVQVVSKQSDSCGINLSHSLQHIVFEYICPNNQQWQIFKVSNHVYTMLNTTESCQNIELAKLS